MAFVVFFMAVPHHTLSKRRQNTPGLRYISRPQPKTQHMWVWPRLPAASESRMTQHLFFHYIKHSTSTTPVHLLSVKRKKNTESKVFTRASEGSSGCISQQRRDRQREGVIFLFCHHHDPLLSLPPIAW